jgi:hypothetical protein
LQCCIQQFSDEKDFAVIIERKDLKSLNSSAFINTEKQWVGTRKVPDVFCSQK